MEARSLFLRRSWYKLFGLVEPNASTFKLNQAQPSLTGSHEPISASQPEDPLSPSRVPFRNARFPSPASATFDIDSGGRLFYKQTACTKSQLVCACLVCMYVHTCVCTYTLASSNTITSRFGAATRGTWLARHQDLHV